jgi:hypothetical protein
VKPVTVITGQRLIIKLKAMDVDGDALTFSIVDGPSGANVNQQGQFTWRSSKPMREPYLIVVAVSDGWYIETTTVEVTVKEVKTIVDSTMAGVLVLVGVIIACVVVAAYKMGSKKKLGKGPY